MHAYVIRYRWHIVIHGGIDGFSRLITFLQASDNNFAQTVGILFTESVRELGMPSRIRTDRGGENVITGSIMEDIRGRQRGSWLRGPSVHNQRIERLWRDLRCFCLNFYIDLFYQLENMGVLDRDSNVHLFSLHYVFLSRLNSAINDFRHAYNNHRVRTMNNRTPTQTYFSGIMARYNSNYLHVRELINNTSPEVDFTEYAVEGNVIGASDNDTIVNVPRPNLGLIPQQYVTLMEGLNQLIPDINAPCEDNGIQMYLSVFVHVQTFINSL